MQPTGLSSLDSTVHTTNIWLNEILERMGWVDKHRAYHALRAVLHALRDRLTVDEVAALSAQLPLLIRGIYYEGWRPHGKPVRERHKDEFLAHIRAAYRDEPGLDTEHLTHTVLQVIAQHTTSGEIESIKRILPEELRELF